MSDGNYPQPEVRKPNQRGRQRGQGLVEYALILALVSIAVIVILIRVGPSITQYFMDARCTLQWKTTGRAFTSNSGTAPTNATMEWRTDTYLFILSDYQNGSNVYCGLQNHATARPGFPSNTYTEPND